SFDITVGPLAKAWGFWQGTPRMPASSQLAEAQSRVGSDKLGLDPRASTISFRQPGMELDFGGLAKGYAVQRAALCALKHGAIATLVNLGGSSLYATAALGTGERSGGVAPTSCRRFSRTPARGRRYDESALPLGAWPVAVAAPRNPAMPALYLILESDWAISTSGTYEQQFQVDGRAFSHLLNPRSGWPVEGLRSATVVARSGRGNEVLTKRVLVSASEEPRAVRKMLNRCDWVLLEAAHDQPLFSQQNFRRSSVLVPAPDQLMILCYRSLIGERPGSLHPARDRSWRKRRALAKSFMICALRSSGPLNLRSSRRRFQKRISIVPDVILSEK